MAEDVAIKLYDLLINKGTYEKVSDVDASVFEQFVSKNGFSTLDLHCPTKKQKDFQRNISCSISVVQHLFLDTTDIK